ncbi:MAG: hypothetical protein WB037_02190, partial [Pseudolabrys sp.]
IFSWSFLLVRNLNVTALGELANPPPCRDRGSIAVAVNRVTNRTWRYSLPISALDGVRCLLLTQGGKWVNVIDPVQTAIW